MGWSYYRPQGRIDRLTECRNVFGREPSWATIVKDALVDDVYYAAMRSTKTNKVWALIVMTDVVWMNIICNFQMGRMKIRRLTMPSLKLNL